MKKKVVIFVGLIAVSMVFILLILYVAVKEISRVNQIEKEIQALRDEAEKIKRNNLELQEKIAYFGTIDYQEKVAKDKLNMQKEDEGVSITRIDSLKNTEVRQESAVLKEKSVSIKDPIYKKWWSYFFNK